MVRRGLLSDEDRKLLLKVYNLLEDLLETLEILEDEDLMREIREAVEDVRLGRVREYSEFIRELREAGEI